MIRESEGCPVESRRLLVVVCAVLLGWVSGCSYAYGSNAPPDGTLPQLGVTAHVDTLSAAARHEEFGAIAAMGATWIRLGIPWYAVQPTNGQSVDAGTMRTLDMIMSEATSAGLHVLFVGDQAPSWAGGGSATASMPDAYGRFMGRMAQHFRGRGVNGTSPAYELMNEPDGDRGDGTPWAPASQYAAAACSAYREIKSGDPGTQVVAGSLDVSDWRAWLQTTLHDGLTGCFDALSAHPYSGLRVLGDIRSVAADAGRPDVSVWVTEFGFSTCADNGPLGPCTTEGDQATRLVALLQQLRADYPWVPVAVVYQDHDEPGNAKGGAETSFGLWRTAGAQLVPKPAVAALRSLYR
jgi:hypothetical protein